MSARKRMGLLAGVLLVSVAHADNEPDLKAATRLPMRAASLRKSGVSAQDVAAILAAAQQQGLRPEDAMGVLQATEEAVRSGKGTISGLGAFVRTQLEAGLRGQALSDAIKAEKARQQKPPAAPAGGN